MPWHANVDAGKAPYGRRTTQTWTTRKNAPSHCVSSFFYVDIMTCSGTGVLCPQVVVELELSSVEKRWSASGMRESRDPNSSIKATKWIGERYLIGDSFDENSWSVDPQFDATQICSDSGNMFCCSESHSLDQLRLGIEDLTPVFVPVCFSFTAVGRCPDSGCFGSLASWQWTCCALEATAANQLHTPWPCHRSQSPKLRKQFWWPDPWKSGWGLKECLIKLFIFQERWIGPTIRRRLTDLSQHLVLIVK